MPDVEFYAEWDLERDLPWDACKSASLGEAHPPGLDALRSCVGLLRRFSGRYVCGLRSGDLMEEFCRREYLCVNPWKPTLIELRRCLCLLALSPHT